MTNEKLNQVLENRAKSTFLHLYVLIIKSNNRREIL